MRRHFNNLLQCFFVSVSPMIIRRVRANLNREAEKAALDVFSENLRNLLLTPPCKGTTILGIDPGKLTRFGDSLFLATFIMPCTFWLH